MGKMVRFIALVVVLGSLVAVPQIGIAGESLPRRVAQLDGDHPGTFDPDGNGQAKALLRLDRPDRRVCYRVAFDRIVIRGVYVYRRTAEEVTDYFVKLYDFAPTEASPLKGCVSDADAVTRAQIREMKRHPTRFYVRAFEYDGNDIAGTLRRP